MNNSDLYVILWCGWTGCYNLIAKGLREGTDVKKVVHLYRPSTLNEFLAIAKIYNRYEKELYGNNLNKSRKEEPVAESPESPSMRKRRKAK